MLPRVICCVVQTLKVRSRGTAAPRAVFAGEAVHCTRKDTLRKSAYLKVQGTGGHGRDTYTCLTIDLFFFHLFKNNKPFSPPVPEEDFCASL